MSKASTRRRVLRAVAPVAGLLAAALLVWQGSYAAFTATTTNPGNAWAAGTVSLTDDDTGGNSATVGTAMFSTLASLPAGSVNGAGLKPGSTAQNCIQVTNNGSLGGLVKFYVAPTTLSQTNALADNLTITVEEGTGTAATKFGSCTGFSVAGAPIVNGVHLSAINTTYAAGYGTWNSTAGASRFYRVTYTLDAGAANSVQGGTAQAAFQWEIQA
jgi:hypothetical protein